MFCTNVFNQFVLSAVLQGSLLRRKNEVQGLMDKILYQRALDSMEETVSKTESKKFSPQPPKFPDSVRNQAACPKKYFNLIYAS